MFLANDPALMIVSKALRRELGERRSFYNARFREAQFRFPRLDAELFAAWLREGVAPVVDAVASAAPERVPPIVEALYDLSLSLVSRDLLGPAARSPIVNAGWLRLLPAAAPLIADDPGGLAARLVNALLRLAERGARVESWIEEMTVAASSCRRPDDLLLYGRVAAWRAGLPELKPAALAAARHLDPTIVGAALGLSAGNVVTDDMLTRLAKDPWLTPEEAAASPKSRPLRIAGEVGAFRGFGGVFVRPPLVLTSGDDLVAFDGESTWLVRADCFGAALFRLRQGDPGTKKQDLRKVIGRDGRVCFRDAEAVLPELAGFTSAAFNDFTLAVTLPLSHAIFLVARAT